jgi:leader peptidase (prepilin peptidase) / N-methyltransferase
MIGASFASFITVLAERIPKEETIMGRSHCNHCLKQLDFIHLIPVFSYLVQGGKSSCCKKRIPLKYLVVEIMMGTLFVCFFFKYYPGVSLKLIRDLFLISTIVLISLIDYEYQIIPDELLIIILLVAFFLGNYQSYLALLSTFAVTLVFFLIHMFSKGRAMGFGDVKYVFVSGLLFSPLYYLLGIYIAILTGGVVSAILILVRFVAKEKIKSEIAFGPFLSVGFIVALWYLV